MSVGHDSPSVTGTAVRLGVVGATVSLQVVVLWWALASPGTLPSGGNVAVIGLAVVSAAVLAVDARATRQEATASWWRPDWRQWALGGLFPGPNAGVFLGYLLRRHEAATAQEPSGYWKPSLVAGVVLTTVGSVLTNTVFDPQALSPLGAVVLVAVLVAVGFTFVAAFYDIQYVALAREAAGQQWFADGYHWLAPVGFPIPGRIFFLAIYVFRRRLLLGRIAQDRDIDSLPTGVGTDDKDTGTDTDDSDGPATLPVGGDDRA